MFRYDDPRESFVGDTEYVKTSTKLNLFHANVNREQKIDKRGWKVLSEHYFLFIRKESDYFSENLMRKAFDNFWFSFRKESECFSKNFMWKLFGNFWIDFNRSRRIINLNHHIKKIYKEYKFINFWHSTNLIIIIVCLEMELIILWIILYLRLSKEY